MTSQLSRSKAGNLQFLKIDRLINQIDLMIAVGGDGTMLRAARHLVSGSRWKTTPLLGINAGHLGFLTFLSFEDSRAALEKLFSSPARCREDLRSCLRVTVKGKKRSYAFDVLNDAVLSKGGLSKIFESHVDVNGEFLSNYRADGLVISTPTGSTAYNLAAGGSILEPTVPAMQLTPICAQHFSNKPIVLSDSDTITIRMGRPTSDVFLTLDGHSGVPIERGDIIQIEKSQKSVRLLMPPGASVTQYFHSLRQKLKWGLVSPAST